MNTKALEFATMLDDAAKFPAYSNLPYAEIANELRHLFDQNDRLTNQVDKLEWENKGIAEWRSMYWNVEKKNRLLTDGNEHLVRLLQVLSEIKPYL